MSINEKYSFKDLAMQDFSSAVDITGDIVRSNFCQLEPNTEIFPIDCTANFLGCNLTNVKLPVGCKTGITQGIEAVNKQVVEQNDLEMWVVDPDTLSPIEPQSKAEFVDLGASIDPVDIPAEKQEVSVLEPLRDQKSLEDLGA